MNIAEFEELILSETKHVTEKILRQPVEEKRSIVFQVVLDGQKIF